MFCANLPRSDAAFIDFIRGNKIIQQCKPEYILSPRIHGIQRHSFFHLSSPFLHLQPVLM
jgi:hypothetical protein